LDNEEIICPIVSWFPFESNWINELFSDNSCKELIVKWDKTLIDNKLYSVIESNKSRISIKRFKLFPSGNRTWNVDIGEKAI